MTGRKLALWVACAPLALAAAVVVLVFAALGAIPDEEPFDFESWPYGDDL